MKRQPKVRVSRHRGLASPDELARALTDYLLGRSTNIPTVRIPNNPRRTA